MDLELSCRCGQFRAVLKAPSSRTGERLRCYCRDCQTYAHYLDAADITLDAHGGTGMWQTTVGGLQVLQGLDHLACLRLSPKGPLRWYAGCCKTPLANTMGNGRLPFVTLPSAAWTKDFPADTVLGPETCALYGGHARGDRSQLKAFDKPPIGLLLRVARRLLMARLRGENRHSPFFDPASAQPRIKPFLLSREERAQAAAQCSVA